MWKRRLIAVAIAASWSVGSLRAGGEESVPPPAAPAAEAPAAPPTTEAPTASGRLIRYDHDRLTVQLRDMQITEVLETIAHQAGAEVRGSVANPRPVTAQFDDLPLPEALHRLLGTENFTLAYGEGDRLRAIKLLGGPQAAGAPAAKVAGTPTPAPNKAGTNLPTLLALVNAHAPVPVTGRLAQALGTGTATLPQILELTIRHDDATVRGEAVRAGLQVLETDPQLRSTFMTMLNGVDDADLAHYIRSMAGPRAEEAILQIMTQSRGSDFRIKASGILQQLRTQGG